jgi:hypothetical protein
MSRTAVQLPSCSPATMPGHRRQHRQAAGTGEGVTLEMIEAGEAIILGEVGGADLGGFFFCPRFGKIGLRGHAPCGNASSEVNSESTE